MGRKGGLALVVVTIAAAAFGVASRGTAGAPARTAHAPTWDDVAPLFAAKCAGCHVSGGIAPFALTSARSAAAHAQSILLMTRTGAMPPWMPGADSPPYIGASRRILTPAERNLLARWVEGGAKLGSGRSIEPLAPSDSAAGTAITLTTAHPYTPHATGGGTDDYHCFLLDPKLTQDVFVTSALIRPQQPTIVHHVILFEASGANAAQARELDAASGGNGWTCFGGPGLTETRASADSVIGDALGSPQWISAWVPGHTTNDLPQGTGVLLHSGSVIVMQVHYNLMNMLDMKMPDQSSAVLKIVPAAGANLTPLSTFLVPAPVELPCPQGVRSPKCSRTVAYDDEVRKYGRDAAFIPYGLLYLCHKTLADYPLDVGNGKSITTSCERTLTRPVRIYGVAGHMHLRGVDIRVQLNNQTLLHIPHWDFHWQDAYYLQQPVDASTGDTIRVTCRFDNSRANQPMVKGRQLLPRYVLWGEGTTDEMCLGLLQISNR